MTFVVPTNWSSSTPTSAANLQKSTDAINALNRDAFWLPPQALSNANGTLASFVGDSPAALVGDATHDNGAKFGVLLPTDMNASTGLASAYLYAICTVAGTNNVRFSLTGTKRQVASGTGTALTGIAATNISMTANVLTRIDISAGLAGWTPAYVVGITANHLGSVDGLATVYFLGVSLSCTQ